MDTKRLKKILAGFSVATLITGAGLTFTGCATTSCSGKGNCKCGKTSCSGMKQEGSQTSCSGKTSCGGKTSCSGSK